MDVRTQGELRERIGAAEAALALDTRDPPLPVNSSCRTSFIDFPMNILRRFIRIFKRSSDPHAAPPVVDNVVGINGSGDWRKRKLAEAAQKYGRPFKCAADDLPHETILGSRGGSNSQRTPRV
jgi:hypothetical protein